MIRLWSLRSTNLLRLSNALKTSIRSNSVTAFDTSSTAGNPATDIVRTLDATGPPEASVIRSRKDWLKLQGDSVFTRYLDLPKLELNPKDNLPADGKLTVGFSLHCQFSRNNCMYTFSRRIRRVGRLAEKMDDIAKVIDIIRPYSEVLECVTSGSVGFKNAAKASYEAGFQGASEMMRRIVEKDYLKSHKLEILFRDFGPGREAFINVLNGKEGTKIRPCIYRVTDRTIVKFGGHRPRKIRRM